MYAVRYSRERGHVNHGWLETQHTFSFADYYDPEQMGFGVLRVINEDRIRGSSGFGMHGHQDMEIITYVISGALEHKDTLGNATIIQPGEIQRMSAGTGIRHSEFNHFEDKKTHLLQIWIMPEKEGITPSYDQKTIIQKFEKDNFILAASRDGRDGSVSLNQDLNLYVGKFKAGEERRIKTDRPVWVQIVHGGLNVNNILLNTGDGLGVEEEYDIRLKAREDVEFLYFDLPNKD